MKDMTARKYTGAFQNRWTLAIEEKDGLIEALRSAVQGRDNLIGLFLAYEITRDEEIKALKVKLAQYDEFIRALGMQIGVDNIIKSYTKV